MPLQIPSCDKTRNFDGPTPNHGVTAFKHGLAPDHQYPQWWATIAQDSMGLHHNMRQIYL